MKLYLISQDKNNGYDTYDSVVVAAESEDDARTIHPSRWPERQYPSDDWVDYEAIACIEVEFLGETTKERGVILASYNAG